MVRGLGAAAALTGVPLGVGEDGALAGDERPLTDTFSDGALELLFDLFIVMWIYPALSAPPLRGKA